MCQQHTGPTPTHNKVISYPDGSKRQLKCEHVIHKILFEIELTARLGGYVGVRTGKGLCAEVVAQARADVQNLQTLRRSNSRSILKTEARAQAACSAIPTRPRA
jgi:hypothetical protein